MSQGQTIRDTPFSSCIGQKLVDITSDDFEEIDENKRSRVYFHFENGETIFATIGDIGSKLMGMIDLGAEDNDERSGAVLEG